MIRVYFTRTNDGKRRVFRKPMRAKEAAFLACKFLRKRPNSQPVAREVTFIYEEAK